MDHQQTIPLPYLPPEEGLQMADGSNDSEYLIVTDTIRK